ncbi:MAG TPA: hypothetical protein VGB63_13080 [Pedobacter sp.]|jgi:hypothetical protein
MNRKNRNSAPATVAEKPIEAQVMGLQVISSDHNTETVETDFQEVTEPQKKPVLNLDETLKLVEDLHLKKRHRDRLELSIDQLKGFEVTQRTEDLDDKNYYQGCIITIKDDNRNEWSTKNPAIIEQVVSFLKVKFLERLGEIEAQIVIPV